MSKNKRILRSIQDKDVIIWGARMTGLGALRWLRNNSQTASFFVDSDFAFIGTKVSGIDVLQPAEMKEAIGLCTRSIVILVAVALKEVDIINSLRKLNIEDVEVLSFQDNDAPAFTVDILGSCNLACLSCPHSIVDHDVPKGSMNFDKFIEVVDKIKIDSPDTTHISLYSWGEPSDISSIPKYHSFHHCYISAL